MAQSGLLNVLPLGSKPTPLCLAARQLHHFLQCTAEPPLEVAAHQPGGWYLLRCELPVLAEGPQVTLALDWLEAQQNISPRALFVARDGSMAVAGVGAAHIHSVPANKLAGENPALLPEILSETHDDIRYFGGVRFDSSDPDRAPISREWASFGQSYWMLPRVELSAYSPSMASETAPGSSDSASSCPSTPAARTHPGGRVLPKAVLAVQLRWRNEDKQTSWTAERLSALECLQRLQTHGVRSSSSRAAVVVSRTDTVSKDDFEARVREACEAFASTNLRKVVLARRHLLQLACQHDPVSLLKQVVGSTYKRHYLFMLQPDKDSAFVSLTPERLCKVQGRDVWTEAVAGTWPLSEYEKIGEAALLSSSAKHNSEHQLVVDYILKLLSEVSDHVKECDTHILKLKHLVHIKQSYHAVAKHDMSPSSSLQKGDVSSDSSGLSSFFCKRMSPTPAVCGLPLTEAQSFIRGAEPWDRGFYAAPCGIISSQSSELIVALRSALVRNSNLLHVYAGAGIVPGSVPSDEYAEISLKMRQFTETFVDAPPEFSVGTSRIDGLAALPNLNSLWATVIVEECVRAGVSNFVICPGSRSTPLVVAVARHPDTKYCVNHDERGAGFYALGWAKAVDSPVAVIVTSGTAVANLLPAAVEACQSQVPLVLLTADRPAELRDTGANQTIIQPGIFGPYTRWAKDFPSPSVDYPLHALLGDVDLALAHATGDLKQHPGPVHLNFCFRENLAPDGGPVRGVAGRSSDWEKAYVETSDICRWVDNSLPRSTYVDCSLSLCGNSIVEEIVGMVRNNARVVVLVGTLKSSDEVFLAEEIADRLQATVFADITSGLRQRQSTVHYADQLSNSEFLTPQLLQLDAVVHLGGPLCSARLNAFAKAAGNVVRAHVRVAQAPIRMDQDHVVTHHLPCCLRALAEALLEAGLEPIPGPPPFWRRLSEAAGKVIDRMLLPENYAGGLTEPYIAQTVSRLLSPSSRLQISSSMPIRDLDFFAKPVSDRNLAPLQPPIANRGASGIDGVISTAIGFCRGSGAPSTLVIGDVAMLHDINALQQLSTSNGEEALPLTIVLVNNSGGGIFAFLPIAKHRDVISTFFHEPHSVDFEAASRTFGIEHQCCTSPEDFEVAYLQSQARGKSAGPCVIEVRPSLSFDENVALHKEIGQAVAQQVRTELLQQVRLSWTFTPNSQPDWASVNEPPLVFLHGWMGEKADWAEVTKFLVEDEGHNVLSIDLPGHGRSQVNLHGDYCRWAASTLFSQSLAVEALADVLMKLNIQKCLLVGYSLGGRVAMAFADRYPDRTLGVVALSANPGLKNAVERHQRWKQDCKLAAEIRESNFEDFLQRWYSVALWSRLSDRKPDVYKSMLSKRRRCHPDLASSALTGMTLALQPDLWPATPSSSSSAARKPKAPLWYAYGELDTKFASIGKKLSSTSSDCQVFVSSIAQAGHALVEECPKEVALLCAEAAKNVFKSDKPTEEPISSLDLKAAWIEPIQIKLRAPLLLSRGDAMPHRSGLLLLLQANCNGVITGLGEVNPLPSFHRETLAEAQQQLEAIVGQWNASSPKIPVEILRLDGSLGRWLEQQCPVNGCGLLPSVRSGLEMALLHLVSRALGSHLGIHAARCRQSSCLSEIGINSLLTRDEDAGSDGSIVTKLKVGKDPLEDAVRTNKLAESLISRVGTEARIRLDANQAWTLQEATTFISNLSDVASSIIEYLEEPLQWLPGIDGTAFLKEWEVLYEKTKRRVLFAIDESLTEGALQLQDLEKVKVPIAALVLKPSLQGFERTAELATWAYAHGSKPVLSSAFESGIALSHFAILAACMVQDPWQQSTSHGLGTFTKLAEDVLHPPFADLVCTKGWSVSILDCQAALNATADGIASSRGSTQCPASIPNGQI